MLKVVGASWLQTRISSYILIAVALLGIGAIILGEFGQVENDGTYSATVGWKRKRGYRIDFWGQGNDLTAIPLSAARAYYKTGIHDNGWSVIEIETSEEYPDAVQAYSAGLLEGSLTWQLIHHHWYNTIRNSCLTKVPLCRKIRRYLRENSEAMREQAQLLEHEDPFWHMVRLFYTQLDGIEAGWRFAVRRSRQDVEMDREDFLWLAMASDLPELENIFGHNATSGHRVDAKGMTFLKEFTKGENLGTVIALAHNTAAPYSRMLRLLKRYKFGYHLTNAEGSALVPGSLVEMTSYPGALSSQDEYYLRKSTKLPQEFVIAGTPLLVKNPSSWHHFNSKNDVMSPVRIMAANRLAESIESWAEIISYKNSGTSNRQFLILEAKTKSILLVEQIPGFTKSVELTSRLNETNGFFALTGIPHFGKIFDNDDEWPENNVIVEREDMILQNEYVRKLQGNITTVDHVRALMRGFSHEDVGPALDFENLVKNLSLQELSQILCFRGDASSVAKPIGVIDTKISVSGVNGIEHFESTSGPSYSENRKPFQWSQTFPNASHIGQPDVFQFQAFSPNWIWV